MTLPSSLKAGFRFASASTVESGRMPSSAAEQLVGVVALLVADGDGDDLVLEAALGRGPRRPLVALHREGVELLARDAPLVGDHLGADALALQAALLGVARHHAGAEGEPVVPHDRRSHRRVRHGLHPGGHDDVVGARHDALRGEVQRLLGGAALAVDRGGGHRLGPAGGEHGVAADVERLLGDLHDAAHDHVVDQCRVELVALGHRLEGLGGQVDGVPAAELPVALPAGGADGVDDDCGGHGVSSLPAGVRRHAGPERRTSYPGVRRGPLGAGRPGRLVR